MFRRPGRGRVLLLVFLALSIGLITLDYRRGSPALDKARDVSSTIVTPIQRGFTAVFRPVGNFFSSLSELGDLRSRNDELQARLDEMEEKVRQAESLEEENEELRELTDLGESWASMDRVPAEVIARPAANYEWAYVIDKGAADGIEEDMAVVHADGLVGKVLSVSGNSATILLLVDPDAGAGARVEGVRDSGVISGHGGNTPLKLDLVSGEVNVGIGDEVVTSGQDGLFPSGIPIGKVSAISGEGSDLEQDIAVEPYVDFGGLHFVQVLLDSAPRAELAREHRSPKGKPGGGKG